MAEVAWSWALLRLQHWQRSIASFLPKCKLDWFFLRERWNRYNDEMRELVLLVANIEETTPRLLETYNDVEKRAIATAISRIRAFADADKALIAREQAKWKKLYEPDE